MKNIYTFISFFPLDTHSLSAELSLVIITPPTLPYRHSKFGQTCHIYLQGTVKAKQDKSAETT
ncbi:hypothetical protein [Prevotella intermedia]|uniref:hypothetical protein n=1 Tax=Prevotella intermedia TaxID=28131 RepID=UPI0012FD9B03|nr:hypothetical protein [Prevotella intermedia]